MTRTRHLDDEALITIAQVNSPSVGSSSHVDSCPLCAHELEAWRRISDLARVSVDLVPPAKEHLPQRVFGQLDSPPRRSSVPPRSRRVLRSRGWSRGGRWVIAVPIVIAALVLSLTLDFGSSAPSDAMVLKTIRSSPSRRSDALPDGPFDRTRSRSSTAGLHRRRVQHPWSGRSPNQCLRDHNEGDRSRWRIIRFLHHGLRWLARLPPLQSPNGPLLARSRASRIQLRADLPQVRLP